jgi:uncharacterized delta-60 repeat protein
MRGSILLTFDELVDDLGIDYITITVAGQERYIRYIDSNTIYTTLVNTGDVVSISVYTDPSDLDKRISLIRRDYTTDDQGGDNGIRDTFIRSVQGISNPLTVTFTATTTSDAYTFRYIISNEIIYETMNINGGFSGVTALFAFGLSWDAEILSSGKIIIGHRYTSYGGTPVSVVTRLLNDGTLDTSFITSGITAGQGTYDIREQSDGKLLISGVGGGFKLYRLNSDGSTDTGFTPSVMMGGSAYNEERIEFQSDGKIIYGNDFSAAFSGYTGLMRFNSNGIIDTTFNSGGSQFSGSTSDRVYDIYVYPDNKILVAGLFNKYNGVTCNGLIKLNSDGTVDTSFNVDTTTGYTFPAMIGEIEVQSDGKILLGLLDTTFNKKYWNNTVGLMWRLNADGTFDSSFPYNQFLPNSGGNGQIFDIYQMNDGSLLIGGGFNTYSGTSVSNLIKLNSNGTLNTTFVPPTINATVTDIEITNDGGVLCTGAMTLLGTQTARGIIKLNPINGSSLIT